MTADADRQRAVQRVVHEVTGGDERLQVTHTVAALGWGEVLYVDVYARSPHGTLNDELDPVLRSLVADATGTPLTRVTIRWRISS